MSLHKGYDEDHSFIDSIRDDPETNIHKKYVRQRLEQRMESRRLKEELEFFDGELDEDFDWNYIVK